MPIQMPCFLRDDPTLNFSFLGATGSSATLFLENDAGTALIESALFNDEGVAVSDDFKITITLQTGINILRVTINGAEGGDQVRVKEDCGGGASRLRQTFEFHDPVRSFRIHAA
jgi:hypothetical protein